MPEPFHGDWPAFESMMREKVEDLKTSGHVNIKISIDEQGKFDLSSDLSLEKEWHNASRLLNDAMRARGTIEELDDFVVAFFALRHAYTNYEKGTVRGSTH